METNIALASSERPQGRAGIDWYQVNEIFTSVQGEGRWTGIPATFIRLQGCTVGCPWCDSGPLADELEVRNTNGETRNTWGKGGRRVAVPDIIAQVTTRHVVITGGEPTLWDLDMLLWQLRKNNNYVQLETSGQNALKGAMQPDWITWSPKQNLDWKAAHDIMTHASEVKWVVDEPLPFEVVKECFEWYADAADLASDTLDYHKGWFESVPLFVLMPEGSPPKLENIAKALSWVQDLPDSWQGYWRVMDRVQYRFKIR